MTSRGRPRGHASSAVGANGARLDRGAIGDTARTTYGTTKLPSYVYLVGAVAALGGLLFGYDTGVISGAQGFLSKTFHLTPTTQEIAVSVVLIGAILGAACGGKRTCDAPRR
jgi:Sugar (and other) transporter